MRRKTLVFPGFSREHFTIDFYSSPRAQLARGEKHGEVASPTTIAAMVPAIPGLWRAADADGLAEGEGFY